MSHIFECEKTCNYLDKLSMNVGVQRVYGLKSLLGDHYQWSDHKKRNIILPLSVSSFIIAEIMRCWLHSDKQCWRRTKFKLVAYISNLLSSNNFYYNVLGEGMKKMLGIAGVPS